MPTGELLRADQLWLEGVERVDLSERSWSPQYAVRPFMALVFHIIQGTRPWIGTPGTGKPSAHFTATRKGELQQHVPLDRVAWTNGSARSPVWPLAAQVPWHYSKRRKRRIQDFNRPTVTFEAEGFSAGAYCPLPKR